ncbi:Hsp70 family protein [Candidatus Pelagibacter sp. HIMB1587]|uniref:Hsp70 family protein n=1 Tax=Candidatus Pelagibacter sp. HIMB1587 TaxID=3413354 RepID=UPI003F8774AE
MTKIIGIDLGTTYSAIAQLDDLGNPEVLSSTDENRKITASTVYVSGEKVIVGDKALDALAATPKNVISETKRQMENDVVYSVEKGEWIEKEDADDNNSYTPAQVSSFILNKLKGYTSDVQKAVITVPALFAEKARVATLDAAKMAGIEVIELINEPTAAACYYASLPNVEKITGKILVFDLGGGTFDVTLCEVVDQKVDVITSRGDKWLGGKDFDQEILNLIDEKYKNETGKNLDLTEGKLQYLEIAERIKRSLSVKNKHAEVVEGSEGPKKIEITRLEFEQSIQMHIEKLKMLLEECIDGSGHEVSEINHTLLVGGSTRIPIISKTIEKVMGKPPLKGVNVDEAVAAGAAVYAGLKSKDTLNTAQKKAIGKVQLKDVCNFYMGTLVQRDDPVLNRKITENLVVIERDTKLPAEETTTVYTIYDDQHAIDCSITQSEGRESNREFVNLIHQGDLEFPDKKPKGREIEITYKYDTSGVMHCTFKDVSSDKKYEISLRPESAEDLRKQYEAIEHIVIE